ncbi:MAG TPA: hypothetical protein VE029_09505 [Rhizobacter sp.]|nr:hypothetical protein [Rhizobacter sp.]
MSIAQSSVTSGAGQTALAEPPRKEAQTNVTPGSKVEATYLAQPTIFFRPDTGEFIFVPLDELTSLENECRRLDYVVGQVHATNQALDVALTLAREHSTQVLPAHTQSEQVRQQLTKAYAAAMEARKQLHGELKPLGKLDSGNKAVVELLPILSTRDAKGKTTEWMRSKKATYARSDKIKSHWKTYPLRADQTKSATKSFIKPDEQGRRKIDKETLVKGVTELKTKYKTEWLKVEEHAVQGVLFDWADSWNKNLSWDYAKNNPDSALAQHVDISASAQLMRYLAGVGLSTEWDPLKGNCAIKASAQAEFAVAEAKAAASLYMPDKLGWLWSLQGDDGKAYPLGAIRFKAELALTGVAGASVMAEGSLAVDFKDEKRKDVFGVKGAAIDAKKNPNDARGVMINGKPVDPGAAIELEAFAGAKADVKLAGAIQWLNPEKMISDYQDFAKVGPSVAGLAGIGAGAMIELTYVAGKFRFKMMASVCLGVGAKGKLELEVDAKLIVEFFAWFFYQLYHANFQRLAFVERQTFDLVVKIQVLLIDGATEGYCQLEDLVEKTDVAIVAAFRDLSNALDKEERRVQLMNRILSQPRMLLHATPEAKGIMLYQLTRHDWRFDGMDARNHDGLAYYGRRKQAIKALLCHAHTKRDFDNIIQHMTSDGSKGDLAKSKAQVMAFLNMAVVGDADDDKEMRDFYDELRASLKDTPSVGYPVYANDTPQYALQRGGREVHPMLASLPDIALQNVA